MVPEVSVIMPCYKQEAWLAEALNAILAQSFSNWECIIISDGSPDNVSQVARLYKGKDHRISFYDTINRGVSAARNFGMTKAAGTYILPLDADDKISTNYIDECLQIIKSSPDIKLVYGESEKFGLINEKWELPFYSFDVLLFENIVHPCGMYRKSDAVAIGGYDEKMLDGIEDWEFWINLMKDGGRAVKAIDAIFYWRRKEESRTTKITQQKNKKLQQYIYKKHAALYESHFPDPIQLFQEYNHLKKHWNAAKKKPLLFFLSNIKSRLIKQ